MELDWSPASPHIRSLYRPWQPGDGYDEAILAAEEARLGLRLPTPLRTFYRAWGKRADLTEGSDPFLNPEELLVRADTLIFWVENQAVFYGGVPCAALEEADPEVVMTEPGPSGWRVESELHWKPSQTSLSGFLDAMTYMRSFEGGAIHGAWSQMYAPALPAHHVAWLEKHWRKATVSPLTFRLLPDDPLMEHCPTLYVREGQAFFSLTWHRLAAREAEAVEELGQRFQIQWASRW